MTWRQVTCKEKALASVHLQGNVDIPVLLKSAFLGNPRLRIAVLHSFTIASRSSRFVAFHQESVLGSGYRSTRANSKAFSVRLLAQSCATFIQYNHARIIRLTSTLTLIRPSWWGFFNLVNILRGDKNAHFAANPDK